MYLNKRFTRVIYCLVVSLFALVIKYVHVLNDLYSYWAPEENSLIFDYIVVGGGSAGSIVARRLSDNKQNKVLVLEAGQDAFSILNVPCLGLLLQKTSYDWQHSTVPQYNACLALDNNESQWPMGKIVGGTGMFNNLIYVRGHREDFDEWFEFKECYDYDADVLPYFERLEKQVESGGSVYVSSLPFITVLPRFIARAAKTLGWPIVDNTAESTIGMGVPRVNLRNGARWTTSSTLKSLGRSNLILKTNRVVTKVLFSHDFEAVGVKYTYSGRSYFARARKGVVLSAGVVGSPKLLMLSGIGDKSHLDTINVRTKVDLPVGDNLQDHVTTGFDLVLLNRSLDLGIGSMFSPVSALRYFFHGSGPWTTLGCEAVAFLRTAVENATSQRPDLQMMVMPLAIKEDDGIHLRRLIGISDETWSRYFALNKSPALTILPVLLHPKSRGRVRLADKNPASRPLIDPRYLSSDEDVRTLVLGIEKIKQLTRTKEMAELGAKLNSIPFPGCESYEFDSAPYWECYIRRLTVTAYHPVGTCKMGALEDPTSVVGYDFQVKRTNNLFVVDGSVLPTLPSGNVNAPIMLMAEIASDVIKRVDHWRVGKCLRVDALLPKNMC
ncbi:glucose dehydrogenase [FAD, quinone]-like [Cylas formicarius]|uniref:glucose dehydrogenase [FAD, quinone]-like n=1 Tax=Cylas formicarius TaxID=197179 RepID=UPI0029583B48|nr:glucose dehydrogenase [FAD, quinone]-like [Cylas formicarius]